MAKRRSQCPPEEAEAVPDWVLTYVEPDWLREDEPQPEDYGWIPPWHWRSMRARERWNGARRAWLTAHGVDRRDWSR